MRETAKKLIMQATVELLRTKKIEDIRITEILQAASVSKRTFYLYFHDKYDVCCMIYDDFTNVCWGVDSERQALPGFIKNASDILDGNETYRFFMSNTMLYHGQNNLAEHVVQRGIFGIKRLLTWNHHEDLLNRTNLFYVEFYMRGLVAMSQSIDNFYNKSDLLQIGINLYHTFPPDLYYAVIQKPA